MMFLATTVVLAGLAHAVNQATSQMVSGVQVVPGPGIAGISSISDIIRDVEGEVFHTAATHKGLSQSLAQSSAQSSAQIPANFCFTSGTVSVSDAQALGTYLHGLPATYECSIQQSQYRSDCALGACVVLATANKARLFMCLELGQTDGISFASVNCNSVANYVKTIIAACNAKGVVYGGQYITPTDYSATNNALGTNARTINDAFFFIG